MYRYSIGLVGLVCLISTTEVCHDLALSTLVEEYED